MRLATRRPAAWSRCRAPSRCNQPPAAIGVRHRLKAGSAKAIPSGSGCAVEPRSHSSTTPFCGSTRTPPCGSWTSPARTRNSPGSTLSRAPSCPSAASRSCSRSARPTSTGRSKGPNSWPGSRTIQRRSPCSRGQSSPPTPRARCPCRAARLRSPRRAGHRNRASSCGRVMRFSGRSTIRRLWRSGEAGAPRATPRCTKRRTCSRWGGSRRPGPSSSERSRTARTPVSRLL